MSAPLKASGSASAGTDPSLDQDQPAKGKFMTVGKDTTAPIGAASEPWTDGFLTMIVGIPLLAQPSEIELPRDHPKFILEVSDVLLRRRDADGVPISEYVIVRQEFIVRRRDAGSVLALIGAHKVLVETNEALLSDEGAPIVTQEEIDSRQARERSAYRELLEAPCRNLDDVRAKAAYILDGLIGDRHTSLDGLIGWGDEDILHADGNLAAFVASLLGERRAPLTFDELIAQGLADGLLDGRAPLSDPLPF